MSLDIRRILEYQQRFAHLFDQLNRPLPEGIDPDIYRSFAIDRFNTRFCNLDHAGDDAEEDGMAGIRYVPVLNKEGDPILENGTLREIAYFMNNFPLFEVFGLTYNDVKTMPLDEWFVIKSELLQYANGKKTRSQVDAEASRQVLVKAIQALLAPPTDDRPTQVRTETTSLRASDAKR